MKDLRVLRAERRITQLRLSLATGISSTRISLFENGLMEPREDEKRKLSEALGVESNELFPMDAR